MEGYGSKKELEERRQVAKRCIRTHFDTQSAFAEEVGLSSSSVSRALKEGETTDRRLRKIEHFLIEMGLLEKVKLRESTQPEEENFPLMGGSYRYQEGLFAGSGSGPGSTPATSGEAQQIPIVSRLWPRESESEAVLYGVNETVETTVEIEERALWGVFGLLQMEGLRGVCTEDGSWADAQPHATLYVPVSRLRNGLSHLLLVENLRSGKWQLCTRNVQEFAGGGLKLAASPEARGLEDEKLLPEDDGRLVNQSTGLPVRVHVVGFAVWPRVDTLSEKVRRGTAALERWAGSLPYVAPEGTVQR